MAEDSASQFGNAAVSVFAPIAAPVLRSVDLVQVAKFLKERERYELEILSKQADLPTLQPLPYTASIDRTLLKSLFFMGKFDEINEEAIVAQDLTDEDIKSYVESLVKRSDRGYIDHVAIEKVLADFSMPMKIADADARITTYCADFFERLESIGCGEFRERNPKKTVRLLLARIQPPALKRELRRRIEFDESLEKNVKGFIRILVREAVNCEVYGHEKAEKPPKKSSNAPPSQPKGESVPKKDSSSSRATPKAKQAPLCVWPKHKEEGKRHYLRDCKDCPKDEKDKLFEELRTKKPENVKRTTSKAKKHIEETTSILFSATFGEKWRTTVCADNGADANILDNRTLNEMKKAGVDHTIEDLPGPRTFDMAACTPDGKPAKLVCTRAIVVDAELHIRHGTALTLRGLRWLVTDQAVGEPLLGRPLLEALGLNTRNILAAAAEKHSGAVDVSTLFAPNSDFDQNGRVSRVLEGVYHAEGGADDADLDDNDGWLDLGPEDPTEKETVLKLKVSEALSKGISAQGAQSLEGLLREFDDVIKLKLDGGEPADIEPLRVRLKPGAVPVRAKQRRYPAPKRNFMTRYVRELLKLGFVKKATAPEWVSAPLIVPKRPPAMYRLTLDYRPVNGATLSTFWPMPNIEAEVSDVRGAKAFAGIDFCSGYWQLPLHSDSQPLFAFMTPDGVVMPTRTTQGGCNSAANFQEKVEQCFIELKENLKAWLDDFMLYASDEDELLRILRRFFEICRMKRLIVSLPKSDFFLSEVSWCGRLINKDGMRFNPKNLSGLKDSDPPRTASELCEYVHGVSWISTSIPRFAERVGPLREILEEAYAKAGGSRKKKSIAKFQLSTLGWSNKHAAAFRDLQEQIQEATRLTHRDPDLVLCISTDASDKHWAVAATQCAIVELDKPIVDQAHEPLAFLSGTFSEREEHWSTYEREAFAIVQAFRKLDYMLACDPSTRIFTDHRNLLFAFNPIAMEPSLGRHKVLKVVRWALFLSAFTYRIEHVPGDINTWPDIMTRWMRGYRKTLAIRRVAPSLPFNGVTESPASPGFEWPSLSDIKAAQDEHRVSAPTQTSSGDDGILRIKGAVWVPDESIDLKLRLLTIAHAGEAGHRGAEPTWHSLREQFSWVDQRDDVRAFVSSCLLCVMAKSGHKVPRPLSTTLHAKKPNEVIHFDYLFLGDSDDDHKYVLVVKDDLSGYCWLEPTSNANAEHTAEVLSRWARVFTTPSVWVSDQGSHFKNEVLEHLSASHRIRHNLTVAYSPWANGTVESVMRSVLAATRAMLAELKLAPQDWNAVIPSIASALNAASLDRLGRRSDGIALSPLEVMTGIQPKRPILRVMPAEVDHLNAKTIQHGRALQVIQIEKLQTALDAIHKDAETTVSERRKRAIAAHNKATNLVAPSFAVGDFVLVRRAQDRGHKLQFRWFGPCRISAVYGPLVYGVTPLRGGKTERVHCARLIKYRDSLRGAPVPKEMLDLADQTESRYEVIEKIVDVGEATDGTFFQVQWEGLPDKRDLTWIPTAQLYADVPYLVIDFLATHKKKKTLVLTVKRHLGLSS